MERTTPVRKSHTSTSDLLHWPENPPPPDSPATVRLHQPSDGISKVVFGGQVTEEEAESLNRRKPCSGYKMKEMTGSGIFAADLEDETLESGASPAPNSRTGLRTYQQAIAGISHISFGEEEIVSPKKPITVAEVAKQRELSGSLGSESESKLKRQISNAKSKELSGNDIFAPQPEILPRSTTARALALRDSFEFGESASSETNETPVIKTSKKIYNQKFNANDIFRGDIPQSSTEKSISVAKLREISGNNIFADVKEESRDYLGGIRKPPGGESSIALV